MLLAELPQRLYELFMSVYYSLAHYACQPLGETSY
jgi:hypothetical protein